MQTIVQVQSLFFTNINQSNCVRFLQKCSINMVAGCTPKFTSETLLRTHRMFCFYYYYLQ